MAASKKRCDTRTRATGHGEAAS
ncbi:protein of unknown function (plasmid) [Ralstonia solanacearum PSI07]|nr:protein of unknown function [Ralstonia solanacearum PSI07]